MLEGMDAHVRREFLKGYLFALAADGIVKGSSPGEIASQAARAFARDLPAVAAELATAAVQQGVERLGVVAREQISGWVKTLRERGFGQLWKEVQEQYERGASSFKR
jgi:hypothetical protein